MTGASGKEATGADADRTDLPFERIAERVRSADLPHRERVDAVVAIARGGTVPGALIAYRLERPLRLMRLAFRDDDNVPRSETPEPVGALPDVRGQCIVLVDDVTVSGATLRAAASRLGAAEVTTVAFKGRADAADVVLFPDVPRCVRWPWFDDVPPPPRPAEPPRAVIVAGVAGSGKSTVGEIVARRLGWPYVEADDHHPPANKAKMARGEALNDDDRAPWLASLRAELDRHLDQDVGGGRVVLSCSALKSAYRRVLTDGRPEAALVLLHGPPRLIAERLRERAGHFFDPKLLDSQVATLELPAPGETALVIGIEPDPERIADRIVHDLRLRPAPGGAATAVSDRTDDAPAPGGAR
ncbi:MAG: gluconokinase, GntK/IdnK-type [Trueperaceae bacterium]